MALRILLVDDEAPALLRLRALLAESAAADGPAVEVVAEARSAAEAERLLQAGGVDLVLLDIGLPGIDGLQAAARWRGFAGAPTVVFVTAHGEHALRAFELDAADYLTKPVRRERLAQALQRVADRRRPTAAGDGEPVFVVSDRGRVLRLPLSEVIYLKAELKYVTLRTAHHRYVLDDTLAEVEHQLGDAFLRIHRNAIVARHAVRALERHAAGAGDGEGWAVRVAPGDEWLAVSRRQLPAVRQALAERS